MNIQKNINKLIIAIKQKGKEIRLETRMFYYDEANKYLTKIILSEKLIEDDKTTWVELYSGFSKVKLLKCLVEYYKKIEGEANG